MFEHEVLFIKCIIDNFILKHALFNQFSNMKYFDLI
jgi:hypothetical protein